MYFLINERNMNVLIPTTWEKTSLTVCWENLFSFRQKIIYSGSPNGHTIAFVQAAQRLHFTKCRHVVKYNNNNLFRMICVIIIQQTQMHKRFFLMIEMQQSGYYSHTIALPPRLPRLLFVSAYRIWQNYINLEYKIVV